MEKQTFITEEGLEKLKEELVYLKTQKRKEIAERISVAKELGDLSENAEYSEAKDEQAFTETRIQELESIIRNVQIIKKPRKKNTVQLGTTVEISTDNGKNMKYTMVGSNEADPSKGKISNESPIGQAFLGHKVDDIVEVKAPKGILKFKIIKIS